MTEIDRNSDEDWDDDDDETLMFAPLAFFSSAELDYIFRLHIEAMIQRLDDEIMFGTTRQEVVDGMIEASKKPPKEGCEHDRD